MSGVDAIVVVLAVLAIAGLAWYFFAPRRARAAAVSGGVQRVQVTIRGGYSPSVIQVRQGIRVEIEFDRQETGDCSSRVVFPDLHLSAALPAHQRTTV
ncbi:MAG: cupredoxin domain-containing protein, partial [Mycobacterium sp.]